MSTEIRHEPDAHRYTLRVDGALASVLEYRENGSGIAFPHTVTVPAQRGKGYADQLVSFAIDDVEATGRGPVTPSCWYVAEWFDRHPERAGLLAG